MPRCFILQVRIAACGCFAAIGEDDWQKLWGVEDETVDFNAMSKQDRDTDRSRLDSSNGKKLLHSFINATKDKSPGVRVAACRLLGTCLLDSKCIAPYCCYVPVDL